VSLSGDPENFSDGEGTTSRGWRSRFLLFAFLAGVGGVCAFAWTAAGGTPLRSLMTTSAAPSVSDKVLAKSETEALRQQIAGLTQSSQQTMAGQQAEIKRLTDQVASLSGRIDQLQRPVAAAPATVPAARPTASAAPKKRSEAKPVASIKPAGRRLTDTSPTGATSTGGAPLSIEPIAAARPAN
jgi:outer membrane murein-binding lipoprotein Lpp